MNVEEVTKRAEGLSKAALQIIYNEDIKPALENILKDQGLNKITHSSMLVNKHMNTSIIYSFDATKDGKKEETLKKVLDIYSEYDLKPEVAKGEMDSVNDSENLHNMSSGLDFYYIALNIPTIDILNKLLKEA